MAGSRINTYASSNTDLSNIMQTLDADRMSKIDSISLTNMSTTSVPAIEAASVVEIANSVYRFSTAEPISTTSIASTAATYWYVELVPSSSTVSARFSTTVPIWRSDYQGFYTSTTSANRMIGKVYFSGTTYDQKAILRWNDRIYVNGGQNYGIISCVSGNNSIYASASSNYGIKSYSGNSYGVCSYSEISYAGYFQTSGNSAVVGIASSNYGGLFCAASYAVRGISTNGIGGHFTAITDCGVVGCAVNYGGFFCGTQGSGIAAYASSNTAILACACNDYGMRIYASGNNAIYALASSNYGISASAVNYAGYFAASGGYAICAVASSNVGIYANAVCNAGIFCASNNYAICAEASSNTAIYASAANTAIYACSAGNTAIRACASSNYGLIGCAINCYGTFSCAVSCLAIVGKSAGWAVCGCATSTTLSTTGEGYPVSGNGVYWNTSDKHLKYLQNVCVTQCLKDRPLTVYKYIWSDQNQTGWDEFISPTAQDLQNTFRLTERDDGMFTTDGIALGLGIELMKDKADKTELQKLIETLKQSTALGANYGN